MDSKDIVARIAGELGEAGRRPDGPCHHPPPRVPDHELVLRIGAGSYGEVWLARSITGQWRAVKGVARTRFSSERPYEREFRGVVQFEPISRAHSGLVQVLHVGRDDAGGTFYYVMELADPERPGALMPDGYSPRTLCSDLKARGRLPVTEVIALGVQLSSALAHIHRHGLVHRDVKPSNVIFVQGQPKLADLGLVTSTSDARSFVGTDGFIPPEGPGTVKADLFALGRLLYECATGKDRCEFPELPSDLDAWPNREEFLEFNEIVTRLCAPDPAARYKNAEEVAGDLHLVRAGRSVRRAYDAERRLQRARRLGAVAVALAALAAGIIWLQDVRRSEAEARANREQSLGERALAAEHEARGQLYSALLEQARATVRSHEYGQRVRALDAIRRASVIRNSPDLRREMLAALELPDLRFEREIQLDPELTLLLPDPDFTRIATGSSSEPVRILSLPDLTVLATLPSTNTQPTFGALWSAQGQFLAVKRDRTATRCDWEIWDIGRTQCVARVGPDAAYTSASFHPLEPRFLVGHGGGLITEWDLRSGERVRELRLAHTPHALQYSADGKRFAVSYAIGPTGMMALYDTRSLQPSSTIELPEVVERISWHPSGKWLSGISAHVSAWSRGVHLIETATGRILHLGEHRLRISASEFTGDGSYLVTTGWDRESAFWDLRTLEKSFTRLGTGFTLDLSADGRHCAVPLPENRVQFFALESPAFRELAGNPGQAPNSGQISPNGRWLAVRDEQHLCVWDLEKDAPAARCAVAHNSTVFFSPDSLEVLAIPAQSGERGALARWRLPAGTNVGGVTSLERIPGDLPSALKRASIAGTNLIFTGPEGVRIVAPSNLATGDGLVRPVPPGRGFVSPDGGWLAMVYDFSPTVGVYGLPAVREAARVETDNYVMFVTFSPNGDEMLVIHRSGIDWYDTRTWNCTRRQLETPVAGSHAFYTPDGTGIWMITLFRNAALLDRHTLEPLLPLPDNVLPLALSPDGHQLAVSVGGRRVQLWDLPQIEQELRAAGLGWGRP